MVMPFLYETYFDNTVLNYLLFFGFVAFGLIIARIFVYFNSKVIKRFAAKTKNKLDDALVDLAEKPVFVYVMAFFAWVGWRFLKFPNYPHIDAYFSHLIYLIVAVNTAWLLSRFVRALIDEYVHPLAARTRTDLDDTLVPILRKLCSFIIYAIAIIMILEHFGQEIGPLLAGLGIGGLAFALAAKDLLANVFGSVTILIDKPFRVGQRIKIGGFDGTVKEINVRTTRIQTVDGTMVYVPNAKFTDEILENVTREPTRKAKMEIGLVYDTSNAKMKKAVDIINNILKKQKSLDGKHLVYFTEFGDFALKILVIYYITDKDNILPVKHEVNMKIKEQLEKAKINMAFPTQTVELKKK